MLPSRPPKVTNCGLVNHHTRNLCHRPGRAANQPSTHDQIIFRGRQGTTHCHGTLQQPSPTKDPRVMQSRENSDHTTENRHSFRVRRSVYKVRSRLEKSAYIRSTIWCKWRLGRLTPGLQRINRRNTPLRRAIEWYDICVSVKCTLTDLSTLEKYRVAAALKFDNGRKYWLKLSIGDYNSVDPPGFFINVAKKRGVIECQTLDLVKLNMRLSDTSNEVVFRSDAIIEQLVGTLHSDASHLFKMCESVGLMDMLASFAQVSTTQNYVRPEITSRLALKSARHPILDKVWRSA